LYHRGSTAATNPSSYRRTPDHDYDRSTRSASIFKYNHDRCDAASIGGRDVLCLDAKLRDDGHGIASFERDSLALAYVAGIGPDMSALSVNNRNFDFVIN
jgi:hypothetical protein